MTFDYLTPKANQHICICDQDWAKFSSLLLRYGVFGSLFAVSLTFWPQNSNQQHIYEPKYISVTKIGWNFLCWFWDMVFTRFWDAHTHALTHRRRSPNTVCLWRRFSTVEGGIK